MRSKQAIKILLNLFFKYAVNLGYIRANPISRVVLAKYNPSMNELNSIQKKYFNLEEMKLFLNFIYSNCDNIRLIKFVEFLFLTGLRVGEASALMWSNVDFENKVLNVNYTLDVSTALTSDLKLTSPKTVH